MHTQKRMRIGHLLNYNNFFRVFLPRIETYLIQKKYTQMLCDIIPITDVIDGLYHRNVWEYFDLRHICVYSTVSIIKYIKALTNWQLNNTDRMNEISSSATYKVSWWFAIVDLLIYRFIYKSRIISYSLFNQDAVNLLARVSTSLLYLIVTKHSSGIRLQYCSNISTVMMITKYLV